MLNQMLQSTFAIKLYGMLLYPFISCFGLNYIIKFQVSLQQKSQIFCKKQKSFIQRKLFKKFSSSIKQMGQILCSNTSQISSQLKYSFLAFQFGEDQKEGKVQHNKIIQCKNIQIQHILKDCIQKLNLSKLMYKDPTMPTDKLILKSISKQNNDKNEFQAIFLRPYKFLNDGQKGVPYKLMSIDDSSPDYILVKDEVMQYFGVFLCFLAANPKIIESLILTQSNTYGLLAVKMNVNGKQTIVYLDDYVLCKQQHPVFCQPVKNIYLWPNILQKAWLKTNGFTQKIIQKSTPQQVFESFINYPYKKISFQQQSQQTVKMRIKKYLYQLQKQYGYILTTKKDPQIHIGISGRKYLYLIGSFVHQNKRLFYIRNPCGRFGFRGIYDQISEEIRSKIKDLFGSFHIQEGNFILQQTQFIEQISGFAICYYLKSLKTNDFDVQLQNNNQIFIQTELKNAGNISFCFRQQSNKKAQTRFSPVTYQIFNMVTGQLVSDQQNNEGCFGVHNSYLFQQVIKKLPQSKYLIRLKKKDKKRHYFGIQSKLIACYTSQLKFDIKNQQQFSQLFKDYVKKQGKRNLLASTNKQVNKKGNMNPIDHIVYMVGDLICIYIEFVSNRNQQYKIQISFPELKNLQLIYPEIDLKETSVLPNAVGPQNREQIIAFQKVDLVGQTELGYFELEAF